MKKKYFLLIGTILILSLFVNCGRNSNDSLFTSGKVKDTLVVSIGPEAKTLDPRASNDSQTSRILVQIYDNLVEQDEDMEIQPGLAESWEHIDPETIIFYLREGIKFHNGEELKASDVKYSLEATMTSPHTSHILDSIETIEILDNNTLKIKTKFPFAPLLNHLAHPTVAIISEKAALEFGDSFGQNPIGTGPYKFVSWNVGKKIELTANENYYKGKAPIKNIIFKSIVEGSSRTIGLELEELDIAYDIEGLDRERLSKSEMINIIDKEEGTVTYLGFNLKKEPFNNLKVRQAIAYAINKNEIIEVAFKGAVNPGESIIAPSVLAYTEDGESYDYNIEKAKELMEEAGYPEGFKTKIWVNDSKQRRDIAVIFQDQLEELGIEVEIEVLEWTTYLDRTAAGEHEMFILSWISITGDPDYGIRSLMSSETHGAGGNRSFYSNPKVDELLMNGLKELDIEKRKKIYREVQMIIREEVPLYIFGYQIKTVGLQNNIEGFKYSPTGSHKLYNVKFIE